MYKQIYNCLKYLLGEEYFYSKGISVVEWADKELHSTLTQIFYNVGMNESNELDNHAHTLYQNKEQS